jgi:hypothetical protein
MRRGAGRRYEKDREDNANRATYYVQCASNVEIAVVGVSVHSGCGGVWPCGSKQYYLIVPLTTFNHLSLSNYYFTQFYLTLKGTCHQLPPLSSLSQTNKNRGQSTSINVYSTKYHVATIAPPPISTSPNNTCLHPTTEIIHPIPSITTRPTRLRRRPRRCRILRSRRFRRRLHRRHPRTLQRHNPQSPTRRNGSRWSLRTSRSRAFSRLDLLERYRIALCVFGILYEGYTSLWVF